ncbi:hypothetical protein ACFVAJ_08525 [Agromyces sp. NPDC057679]
MTTEIWLSVLCLAGLVAPIALGLLAQRRRVLQPVRVQRRPVNRSIER